MISLESTCFQSYYKMTADHPKVLAKDLAFHLSEDPHPE